MNREQLPDTHWHIGYPKMDEHDSRRDMRRCIYLSADGSTCNTARSPYYTMHCGGSSHCAAYTESITDVIKRKKMASADRAEQARAKKYQEWKINARIRLEREYSADEIRAKYKFARKCPLCGTSFKNGKCPYCGFSIPPKDTAQRVNAIQYAATVQRTTMVQKATTVQSISTVQRTATFQRATTAQNTNVGKSVNMGKVQLKKKDEPKKTVNTVANVKPDKKRTAIIDCPYCKNSACSRTGFECTGSENCLFRSIAESR